MMKTGGCLMLYDYAATPPSRPTVHLIQSPWGRLAILDLRLADGAFLHRIHQVIADACCACGVCVKNGRTFYWAAHLILMMGKQAPRQSFCRRQLAAKPGHRKMILQTGSVIVGGSVGRNGLAAANAGREKRVPSFLSGLILWRIVLSWYGPNENDGWMTVKRDRSILGGLGVSDRQCSLPHELKWVTISPGPLRNLLCGAVLCYRIHRHSALGSARR